MCVPREYGGGGNGGRRVEIGRQAWPFRATDAFVEPLCGCTPDLCRSGFTREYGGGNNGEPLVEIGQQARPFRG